jgi:predicted DsbA family dithiol-disulfide isomerase
VIVAEAGIVVVFSDVGCPWSHLAVHRLHTTRARLGLDDEVRFDHRAFPLEVINARPTPKLVLDAEIPAVGALDPDAGWQLWQGDEHEYPVTTLLALEAVQAAKAQGLEASEQLDLALRKAFFGESRCVSMRHVILEVAETCPAVDAERLRDDVDRGAARHAVLEQCRAAEGDTVKGSPHLFLPDGRDFANPGIEMHWEGEEGEGFPVVDADDPSVYEEILKSARR